LTIDNDDNAFVLSKFQRSSNGGYDYDISRITSNNSFWHQYYDSGFDDIPAAVVADSAGNVIITGASFEAVNETGRKPVVTTLKYDSAGNVLWTNIFNRAGFANAGDFVQDVVVDSEDNIYVLATTWDSAAQNSDFLIIKYAADGTELWAETYDDGNSIDKASAAVVDQQGDLIIVGTVQKDDHTNNPKFATAKFSPENGALQWISYYDGQPDGRDDAYRVSVDPAGSIVVSGISQADKGLPSGDYFFATVKYDSYGNELWSYLHVPFRINQFRGFGDMEIDKDGNVIHTGAKNFRVGSIPHTFKLSGAGGLLWYAENRGGEDDSARAVGSDQYGDVYITGHTFGEGDYRYPGSTYNYLTIKYSEHPAPVADAGVRQVVPEGTVGVQLDGSGSTGAVNYFWEQLTGTSIELQPDGNVVNPTFDAPPVVRNDFLEFKLTVDNGAGVSHSDYVQIVIEDINLPPISDAGDDSTIKAGALGSLYGCDSWDPEGRALSYVWTQLSGPEVVLVGNEACNPAFEAPVEAEGYDLKFQLEVSDGFKTSDPDDVVTVSVVANSPPVAEAGPDQPVTEGTIVYLDGANSYDPDGGDTLSYLWSEPSTVILSDVTTARPSFVAPAVAAGGAVLAFDLAVTDDDPIFRETSSDQVVITVQNVNDPPDCTLAMASCDESKLMSNEGCMLWPPNHGMVPVSIVGISDPESDEVALQITGVTQDEPVNGEGDGGSSPDAVLLSDQVLLRAERTGLTGGAVANGRVYSVHFTADDGEGGTCTGSVEVGVPHDRKGTANDDGQDYDSTLP
jgi:hypothetical protein